MPDDPDIQKMLELLPMSLRSGNMELDLMGMILNYILPVFFLIIPVMAASIMSASAFVGEKEKHTLETLLYSSFICETDLLCKGNGILFSEYADIFYFFSGNASGT